MQTLTGPSIIRRDGECMHTKKAVIPTFIWFLSALLGCVQVGVEGALETPRKLATTGSYADQLANIYNRQLEKTWAGRGGSLKQPMCVRFWADAWAEINRVQVRSSSGDDHVDKTALELVRNLKDPNLLSAEDQNEYCFESSFSAKRVGTKCVAVKLWPKLGDGLPEHH